MAKYTVQIRTVVESGVDLFDFDYTLFDNTYKKVLEQKIIDHFYFREIGFETVGQFKHFLKSRLNMILPYYNKLYETENLVTKDNYNINLDNKITQKRTTDQTNSNKASSSSSSSGTNKSVFSDTPQAKLDKLDYATNLTDDEMDSISSGDAENSGTVQTIDQYEEHLLGNGSMRYNADILMEWRKSFLNIDQKIISELEDLFMSVY